MELNWSTRFTTETDQWFPHNRHYIPQKQTFEVHGTGCTNIWLVAHSCWSAALVFFTYVRNKGHDWRFALLICLWNRNKKLTGIAQMQCTEKDLILDYHERYGHMGALKVVKALQEHVYIKDANRKVRKCIKQCHICQLVKVNNERKEGTMIPITTSCKLEKVFVDICGPFPVSYTHLPWNE